VPATLISCTREALQGRLLFIGKKISMASRGGNSCEGAIHE
jgi:hypothetical protein